jgi:hypothetical protein
LPIFAKRLRVEVAMPPQDQFFQQEEQQQPFLTGREQPKPSHLDKHLYISQKFQHSQSQ